MKISVQTVLDLLHSIMHPLSPELVHHLQRTGLICWYLGNRAGFDSAAINNAWLAGMLHNIGALSKVPPSVAPMVKPLLKSMDDLAPQ